MKPCQTKVWRSQVFPEKGRLEVGSTKGKGAYAAMLVLSVFSVPSVRTLIFKTHRTEERRSQAFGALVAQRNRLRVFDSLPFVCLS